MTCNPPGLYLSVPYNPGCENLKGEISGIASLIEGELAQHVALSLYKTGYLTWLYVAKCVPEGNCEMRNAEMRKSKFEHSTPTIQFPHFRISNFAFLFRDGHIEKRRIDNGVVADPRCGSVRVLRLRLLGCRLLLCDCLVVPAMMAPLMRAAGCHTAASRGRLSRRSRLRL